MAWRRSHYVAVGLVAAVATGFVARAVWQASRPLVAAPIVVTSAYEEFTERLRPRETLSNVLARAGIVGRDYAALLGATTRLNTRKLRAGDVFHFTRVRHQPVPHRMMVRTSPERRVWIERRGGDSGWVEREEQIPWTTSHLRVEGVIRSSLYEALDQSVPNDFLPASERISLAWSIAEVYDWEIDFTRDIRPGDRFAVLIERRESPEGERRVGRILAGRVEVAGHPYYAFTFDAAGQRSRGFYDERGRSLRRAFLKSPVAYRRISSRFGGRYHPILGRWRNHQGTDYSASPGTPVRATADGMVTRAGRDGGYGNLVELRHANGIRTRYGHLSGFAAGVRVGARVRQNETIGYVGSTGLSTGPHLHYEFLVNGRATNPQRRDAGSGEPVATVHRARFDAVRQALLAALEPPAGVASGALVRVD
jgi:murein DD-endopeptidase MepM/ murein hydrolase activator NlpD